MTERPKDDGSGIRLPSSGMADEILGKLKRGELASDEAAPPERSGSPTVGADVERIYTFTDSLQLGEEEEEEREVYETWVEFRLADRSYALPVEQVQEILRVGELTPIPQAPATVLGVFNLRGRVVPLLDLRARLDLDHRPADAASRVVVVESESRRLGLLVDSVERVARLAQSAMQRVAGETPLEGVLGLHSTAGRDVLLLDLAAILKLPAAEAGAGEPAGGSPPGGD